MTTAYSLKKENNGVYAFILKGSFLINGEALNTRDGIGIWNTDSFELIAQENDSEILLMEVPMKL
jgi:redox-sensitive bicupin YhaK (pirin superfamily)